MILDRKHTNWIAVADAGSKDYYHGAQKIAYNLDNHPHVENFNLKVIKDGKDLTKNFKVDDWLRIADLINKGDCQIEIDPYYGDKK